MNKDRFENLVFEKFEPFVNGQKLLFPEKDSQCAKAEVQLLTGENGTGKTRVLAVLAAIMGNQQEMKFRTGHELSWNGNDVPIRKYGTANGSIQIICEGTAKGHTFVLAYRNNSFISSHVLPAMDDVDHSWPSHLDFYKTDAIDKNLTQHFVNLLVKIGIANSSDDPAHQSIHIINTLNATVTDIIKKEFRYTLIPKGKLCELQARVGGKTLSIEQLPDGLKSLLKFMNNLVGVASLSTRDLDRDIYQSSYIILLDEPETHLHPKWQRHLLPAVQKLFPNAQIICATHSPFIISSVNEGGF
ncbi:MAG: AAA family ATPase, partial [Gemmataceae bacterium]